MKMYISGGLLLLALGQTQVIAGDNRKPFPSNEPPVSLLPISMDDNEPRAPLKLRDVFRHPLDEQDDLSKPYRLTVEERHRLREQLRSQASNDPKK